DPDKIIEVDDSDVARLFETVVELAGRSTIVVGMGNIGNHGLEIVQYFRNRSTLPDPQTTPQTFPQPDPIDLKPANANGNYTEYIPQDLVLAYGMAGN
ncbi:MAG: hypothetical protein KDA84_00515, partial [Planctomycetaceae bacterium]|nr:hypothetical protein [Planctomycetaceae bacterium]